MVKERRHINIAPELDRRVLQLMDISKLSRNAIIEKGIELALEYYEKIFKREGVEKQR